MKIVPNVTRVKTAHGPGLVVGFEAFDGKGSSLPVQPVDAGGRVVVKLDPGHAWPFTGLYYEQPRSLELLP